MEYFCRWTQERSPGIHRCVKQLAGDRPRSMPRVPFSHERRHENLPSSFQVSFIILHCSWWSPKTLASNVLLPSSSSWWSSPSPSSPLPPSTSFKEEIIKGLKIKKRERNLEGKFCGKKTFRTKTFHENEYFGFKCCQQHCNDVLMCY